MRDRGNPQQRSCVVTRRSGSREDLVRFVLGPEGEVVPDVSERLPGRGAWVGAEWRLVAAACSRNLFARALRAPAVRIDSALPRRTEAALARRLIESLGLARRAGGLVGGFEKTRERLRNAPVGALIEASDGAVDGCRRLRSMQPSVPRIACLSAAEVGNVFGRERTVHAALDLGGNLPGILRDARRLQGFRRLPVAESTQGSGCSCRKTGG